MSLIGVLRSCIDWLAHFTTFARVLVRFTPLPSLSQEKAMHADTVGMHSRSNAPAEFGQGAASGTSTLPSPSADYFVVC
ncbi:MAG: hypothetical protein ACOH1R_09265 [Luteimonas sp.]